LHTDRVSIPHVTKYPQAAPTVQNPPVDDTFSLSPQDPPSS
jgi:hypothetical protein